MRNAFQCREKEEKSRFQRHPRPSRKLFSFLSFEGSLKKRQKRRRFVSLSTFLTDLRISIFFFHFTSPLSFFLDPHDRRKVAFLTPRKSDRDCQRGRERNLRNAFQNGHSKAFFLLLPIFLTHVTLQHLIDLWRTLQNAVTKWNFF